MLITEIGLVDCSNRTSVSLSIASSTSSKKLVSPEGVFHKVGDEVGMDHTLSGKFAAGIIKTPPAIRQNEGRKLILFSISKYAAPVQRSFCREMEVIICDIRLAPCTVPLCQ